MPRDISKILIYHITDIENLEGILRAEGLYSDRALAAAGTKPIVIGYPHIKHRRMYEIQVGCCGNRFVGEFVPFYYCPRSPMLYAVNKNQTGRGVGGQETILHLVSTVERGIACGDTWSIADGNAGAAYPSFFSDVAALDELDWNAIEARYWQNKTNEKSAEFLVADFVPWTVFHLIGCHNDSVKAEVEKRLAGYPHRPQVVTMRNWYY